MKIVCEFVKKGLYKILPIQVIHSGISCIIINNLHDANLCDQRLICIIIIETHVKINIEMLGSGPMDKATILWY